MRDDDSSRDFSPNDDYSPWSLTSKDPTASDISSPDSSNNADYAPKEAFPTPPIFDLSHEERADQPIEDDTRDTSSIPLHASHRLPDSPESSLSSYQTSYKPSESPDEESSPRVLPSPSDETLTLPTTSPQDNDSSNYVNTAQESNFYQSDEGAQKSSSSQSHRHGPSWPATIVVMIVAVALALAGSWWLDNHDFASTSLGSSGAKIATQAPVITQPATKTINWETVAKAVRSSVVAISVSVGNAAETGSGVIFDRQGHVLTNYHVISAAYAKDAQLVIQLSDGRLYEGKVIGSDPTTDLAVLSIKNPPSNLTMVSLGSSNNLHVGQPVAAIGNPLGLSNSMTTGIISALDRPVIVNQSQQITPQQLNPFDNGTSENLLVTTNAIQVDAAINPGNSGGPLFSQNGTVIGITSSIASLSSSRKEAGSIGIGFAIPINLAKKIVNQILRTGKAQHALLGVRIGNGTATVNGTTRAGAKVVTVEPHSAADKAQIRPGDVITRVNQHVVSSGPALTGYIRWYLPGETVKITVVRNGKKLVLPCKLETARNSN